MNPGDIATINFPGHKLHGKKVRIESIETLDLAHRDCPEVLIAEVIFYSHPSISGVWGIDRERLK